MSTWGDERHVSDEELSDLVDGEAGTGVEEHVAGCPSCAARLDGWRSVSRRLGSLAQSSPVPSARRDEAVAAAMEVAATAATGGGAGGGGGGGAPAHPASPSASRSPALRGRRDLGRLAGLAAAAAVVAGAAVGVAHLGHHATVKSADRGAAEAPRSVGSASPTSGPSAGAPSFAGAPPAFGTQSGAGASSSGAATGGAVALRREFGSLGGPAAVAAAVESALGSGTGAGAGVGAEGGSVSAAPAAPAPDTAAATGPGAAGSAAAPAAGPAAAPAAGGTAASCPDTAKLFPGASPRLLLTASATYRGTPAEVYAYRVGGDRRALVVATRGCALLADIALTAGSS